MHLHFRFFHGETDWGWVKTQIPSLLRSEDTMGLMAIDVSRGAENSETVAAMIIDNITKNSCQAHFMASSSLVFRHQWIEECADYLFLYRKFKSVYGTVSSRNKKALKINERMGFEVKTILEDGYDDDDHIVVMELLRENCPFLRKEGVA